MEYAGVNMNSGRGMFIDWIKVQSAGYGFYALMDKVGFLANWMDNGSTCVKIYCYKIKKLTPEDLDAKLIGLCCDWLKVHIRKVRRVDKKGLMNFFMKDQKVLSSKRRQLCRKNVRIKR